MGIVAKKYAKQNFHLTIIADYPTRKEASDHEQLAITDVQVNDENCYNLRLGGDAGAYAGHTIETIELIRAARIGIPMSPECIENRKKFWKDNPEILKVRTEKIVNTRRLNNSYQVTEITRQKISDSLYGSCRAKHYECKVENIIFPTILAAAKHFGITFKICKKRILSSDSEWINWNIVGDDQPTIPTNEYKRDKRFKQCEIDGVIYDNYNIAAFELNIDVSVIIERLNSDLFDSYKIIHSTYNMTGRDHNSIKCIIDGVIYGSALEASKYLGVSDGCIRNRIKNNKEKWKNWTRNP